MCSRKLEEVSLREERQMEIEGGGYWRALEIDRWHS